MWGVITIAIVIILLYYLTRRINGIEQRGGAADCRCAGRGAYWCPCTNTKDSKSRMIDQSSLYTSALGRSAVSGSRLVDGDYSPRAQPANFVPPCMTQKPYGNEMATYWWWKYFPMMAVAQYADCDKYGCATTKLNGYTARGIEETPEYERTRACATPSQEYYKDAERYCGANGNMYPCQNYWLENPKQFPNEGEATAEVIAETDRPFLA